jgi:hypothetical protein
MFDTKWDNKVRQSELEVDLEIQTDRKPEWKVAATWKMVFDAQLWTSIESGSSIRVYADGLRNHFRLVDPPDLHKYTLDHEMKQDVHSSIGPTYEISKTINKKNNRKTKGTRN